MGLEEIFVGSYLNIVTDAVAHPRRKTHDGASVGMDFGLKTYLTLSDGTRIENPLFLRQGLNNLRKASQRLSKCERGSAHRLAARLAHELCRAYDTMCVEDLQLTGMSRLWGRKMADLAEHLDLRDRQWTCPQCGTTLDRDVNAATNIMRQGIAPSGSTRKTKVTLRKGR